MQSLSVLMDSLIKLSVLSLTKKKVKPGEQVSAIVKGEKDSVVFLLAVDKSVKLLKSGNDITQDLVREELAGYDFAEYDFWRYMFICGWPSYFGGLDASTVLENAGVNVLTDGLVYKHQMYDSPIFYTMRSGPMAMEDSIAMESSGATKTRKLFPETWLWDFSIIKDNGEASITLIAPDTITTWIASAFSVNPVTGLSVAAQPAKVTTFINIFISLELPSSIVRNEDFCFPASVFSYYSEELPIMLTLNKSPDYESLYVKEVGSQKDLFGEQLYYSHFLGFMKENDTRTVTFCFKPITIGEITISIEASTGKNSDGIGDINGIVDSLLRTINVKPEGVPRATTKSFLVEITNGEWVQNVPVKFPDGTVPDSERISVNVAGNLLGSIFENLEDLVQKPYGCGEQNMINFSPIMSLLDFFFTTETITEELREKSVNYMLIGYQKEIMYEHGKTGGYSTFGNSNRKDNASLWLTAFVTKCFAQAQLLESTYGNILAIDNDLMKRSSFWMLRQQLRDGSFVEYGRVFNKRLQGGSGEGISLTAYSLIALHHAQKVLDIDNRERKKILSGKEKAKVYLERKLEDPNLFEDPYDVCITAYALNLVNSSKKDDAFEKMEKLAIKGGGLTYWKQSNEEPTIDYYWSRHNDAINIEMTSYALLTYSLRGIAESSGLPIVRWLSKKKGPKGGFVSTQDTVIGIEALTSVAKKLYGSEFVPMTISVNSLGPLPEFSEFQVTKDNEMLLQRKDIPFKMQKEISLNAKPNRALDSSKSTVLVDVVFSYNVDSDPEPLVYAMDYRIDQQETGFIIDISLSTTDGKQASMTMVEVDIPAGHNPDMEFIKEENDIISRIDMKDDRINFYLDSDVVGPREKSVILKFDEGEGKLITPKPHNIKVYEYYNPDNEVTRPFSLKSEKICKKISNLGICQFEVLP